MNTTTQAIAGIKEILTNRWPESLVLFDKMLSKAESDAEYSEMLNFYLLNGSTLRLQDLVSSFGDLSKGGPIGTAFRNLVYPIDTASHLYRSHFEETANVRDFRIVSSVKSVLRNRWPESEELLDKMINKALDDGIYAQQLKSYFSQFDGAGSTLLLRHLTSSFGNYFEPGPNGLAFQNDVDAIDAAHSIVGESIPCITELLG